VKSTHSKEGEIEREILRGKEMCEHFPVFFLASFGNLIKYLLLPFTRLETRTKESGIIANMKLCIVDCLVKTNPS